MTFGNFLAFPLDQLPFIVLVLIISFTVHEFAHAYTAYKFGDPTAKLLGRVTLNPAEHISLIGMIFFVLAGFGWAKPVPVDRSRFRKPRLMGVITTAAGPVSNLVLAFIGVLAVFVVNHFHMLEHSTDGVNSAVYVFLQHFIRTNLILFLFNLIPIPPLDGYRILYDIAPQRAARSLSRYEQWALYIFLLLIFIPPLSRYTLGVLFQLRYPLAEALSWPLSRIYGFDIPWRLLL
ncbi:zinc metalloprotease [Gordoniibacillus kamchatkensis]|uniref:Zinc metalloprotease n=1 Tax=Gordoniibacillus kamchatkensis TaxID=1590651 RepID=A0ABR5ABE8_9BACL|nr:site-2 protease family protein [Paenibacillus sp. VKM B-2647]KIL38285.1 zinc metalloprotease [Paenibacillus sp. VKM B-2647]